MAEDAQRLLFALLLLAGDEGDDVADHLRPVLEGLAGAGDCLVGGCCHLVGLKLLPRGKGRGVGLDGAVGLDSDKAPRGAKALLLIPDDLCVLRVDLRDDHRDIRGPAVCGVVGDDRRLGLCVLLLDRTDLILGHVYGGEDKVHILCNALHIRNVLHDDLCGRFRNGSVELPSSLYGLAVGLSCASSGGSDLRHLKPRMMLQDLDESLTDHAGAAKYANS